MRRQYKIEGSMTMFTHETFNGSFTSILIEEISAKDFPSHNSGLLFNIFKLRQGQLIL